MIDSTEVIQYVNWREVSYNMNVMCEIKVNLKAWEVDICGVYKYLSDITGRNDIEYRTAVTNFMHSLRYELNSISSVDGLILDAWKVSLGCDGTLIFQYITSNEYVSIKQFKDMFQSKVIPLLKGLKFIDARFHDDLFDAECVNYDSVNIHMTDIEYVIR